MIREHMFVSTYECNLKILNGKKRVRLAIIPFSIRREQDSFFLGVLSTLYKAILTLFALHSLRLLL